VVWFLFGALLVPVLDRADWRTVAYAVLSLTVIRMVPVALALTGAGLSRATIGIIGWFGPRGLASVVFALLAFDELRGTDGQAVLTIIATVVLMSVVAHGASASPLARWYGARAAGFGAEQPEHAQNSELATRPFTRRRNAH